MCSLVQEQKRKMVDDRRAAQPDIHALLVTKEQAFRDEIVQFNSEFA